MISELKEIRRREIAAELEPYKQAVQALERLEQELAEAQLTQKNFRTTLYRKFYQSPWRESSRQETEVELDPYKQAEQALKRLEEELELAQMSQGSLSMIMYKKFSWIQKHITQRREYREYSSQDKKLQSKFEEIAQRLADIKKQIEERSATKTQKEKEARQVETGKTIQDMGIDIHGAEEVLREHGIPIVLSEEDKTIADGRKPIKGLEDLVLVHKTKFAPTGSKIKSDKEAGAMVTSRIVLDGKEYSFSYAIERNTIHFAVNGEVSSHIFGNWDDCKYAILIPFTDIPRSQIRQAPSVDTFTYGGVELTSNSWILCPQGEGEKIKHDNPNVQVIEYRGERVLGYADAFVSTLGYQQESGGMWSWTDQEAQKQYSEVMIREGFTMTEHAITDEKSKEKALMQGNRMAAILNVIRRNHLVTSLEDVSHIFDQLQKQNEVEMISDEQILYEILTRQGIQIPREVREVIEVLSQNGEKTNRENTILNIDLPELFSQEVKKLEGHENPITRRGSIRALMIKSALYEMYESEIRKSGQVGSEQEERG